MKVTRVLCFVVLAFGVSAFCLFGEEAAAEPASPERLFSRGNDYYEKGEYDRAISEYEKILAGGYESGPFYYNLAGAYFKDGRLGKAMLNYERARRIMPRDADLAANYRFALANVKGRVKPAGGIWNSRFLRMYSGSFTVDEITWSSSGLYVMAVVLLFLAVIRPRARRYCLAGALLLFVFIVFNFLVIRHKAAGIGAEAVTVALREEALFGPFESATKFFTLHEGMGVTVLTAKNGWYKVRRADGKVGWVRAEALEVI